MAQQPDSQTPPRRRPSQGWYLLAVTLLLVGVTTFGMTVQRYRSVLIQEVESLQRLIVPGGGPVTFDQGGQYTVFYESDGTLDGQLFRTPRPMPIMRPRALNAEGEVIGGLQKVREVQVYNAAGRAGHAMWHWQIPSAGTYHLDAEHLSELSTPLPLMLGVGRLTTQAERYDPLGLYGAAGVLAFSLVAAIVMTLVTFLLRSGHHTRRDAD